MHRPPYVQQNTPPGQGRGIAGGFRPRPPFVYPPQHPNNFTFLGNPQYPMNVPNLPQQNPFPNPCFNQPPNPYLLGAPAALPRPAPLNKAVVHEHPASLPQPAPLKKTAVLERPAALPRPAPLNKAVVHEHPAALPQPAPLKKTAVLERPAALPRAAPSKKARPTALPRAAPWKKARPAASPHPAPLKKAAVLERLEAAVVKIHHEMTTAGESVSAWKVSQAALVALKADSWDSLGVQLQDVPSLLRLIIVEGKVNAFIHCSIAVRKIISLYDLEVALCKSEGVRRFEELGLGPLSHHPLIQHYFSIPNDLREVFKITTEEIIGHLKKFMERKSMKSTTAEGFLDFLAQKKSVSSKERLGVRIQSLGLIKSCIWKAKNEEKIAMSKSVKSSELHVKRCRRNITPKRKHRKDILSEPPVQKLQKKSHDGRFESICKRVESFSFTWSCGKHIRFSSSEDEVDEVSLDNDESEHGCTGKATDLHKNQSSSYSKDSGKHVSSCLYPSTSKEIAHFGLKLEKNKNSSVKASKSLDSKGKRFSGNKRKFKEKNSYGGYSSRIHKRRKKHYLDDGEKSYLSFNRSNMMKKFITTWKESCQQLSVPEIVNMMTSSYSTTVEQKKMLGKFLLSYPCLGVLNVAVASIRRGLLDSPYDAFQSLNEACFSNKTSDESTEIEIVPLAEKNSISVIGGDGDNPKFRITVNDIIRKIIDYVNTQAIIPRESEFSGNFQSLKKLCDCETWLIGQFSAKEFSSFGHGSFTNFLEKYSSLLPHEVYNFICGKPGDTPAVVVSMPQEQLRVFLSQAHDNVIGNGVVKKNAISMLLKKQFPTISFDISGKELDKRLSSVVENHRTSGSLSCVLFSVTLLGKQWSDISSDFKGNYFSEVDEFLKQETSPFGTLSFRSALECLLSAPMLSDLVSWSHWDIVYASSLGPLLEWLLYEVDSKVLLCIVTRDGKLIKVDPLATVDDYLETFIQCSSFKIAVKMLSLVALYRGTNNAPISLLKCYTKQAIDVVIRNSIDSWELKDMDENCVCRSPSRTAMILQEDSNPQSCDLQGNFKSSPCIPLVKSLPRLNKAATIIARLILECLSHLPSEFWTFVADILVSGFQSFIKEAPLIILLECKQLEQRLMLHEIGLSLGVTEWIQDYKKHSSVATNTTDAFSEFSMTKNDPSEASVKPHHCDPGLTTNTIVDSISNEGHESSHEKNGNRDDGSTDDCLTTSDIHKADFRTEVPDDYEMTEYNKVREASHIIENIRHEEFGLDKQLTDSESFLLQKQHARLGRALHCLSQELYSQDSHLLLELIQNADDNTYSEIVDPTLVFILQDNGIVVLNNEKGFSAQNIRALCDIGRSTKTGSNAGYIGRKGLGFKSVFRVTDTPEIHSNGFHIKFDISEGQIGFVMPTLISPCDKSMFGQLLADDDFNADFTQWNTCILLPFRSKFVEGTKFSSTVSMFLDLHPALLLFLHRLHCIKFKNMLDGTSFVMRREIMNDGIVKVTHGKETMSWLVINKKLQAAMFRHSVQTTEIALAFTLQETEGGGYKPYLAQQAAFAFLPLRHYGLKFILQGDFILPSSREEVDGDSAWNQWLLSEFPALFVSAEQSFCSLPSFQKSPGKAVTAYMSFVPLVAEVHGFFSPLPHMIITRLRLSNCLLLDGPNTEWVLPCRALRGWTDHTRMVLSDNLLKEHLGLGYLSRDVFLSDTLARALGVQEYGPKILIDFISSLCLVNEGIKSMGSAWLSSWLVALHSTMLSQSFVHSSLIAQSEVDVINNLRKLPFVPLSDGSYSSISDGSIWLLCDDSENELKDFPILYAKLRIVDPLLFASSPSNKVDVMRMLFKLGVRQLSAHEVIRNHVLVALSDDKQNNNDEGWKIEYVSFIMVHFQFPCANCHTEKQEMMSQLREKHVILTNDGCKCAADEPIHFSKEYGNPVDINKLIDSELKWFELDAAYLKHPSTRTLSSGPAKCREFFMELGVTDFVQVCRVDKNASDFLQSNDMECSGVLIDRTLLISDWESSELVTMLSTFSSKKCRDKCIYVLEVLDKLWDEYYSAKATIYVTFETIEHKKLIESSFMRSIREIQWIASSLDQELHYPSDLFYDCQELRSLLGVVGPYVVPKVTSKLLLKDIRFRTELSYDNALKLLHCWSMSKSPLVSSAQMSRFYTYISDGVLASKVKLNELIEGSFIFVPFLNISEQEDITLGTFYSPKHVYWYDPTGCAGRTKEMFLKSMSDKNSLPCQELSNAYPGLHDFFVNVCGVPEVPPFGGYLQILLHLSSVSLPSQAAHAVFKVLLRWSDDLQSGLVKSDEVLNLKENLQKLENRVLPTSQDKWVSLHPSFGLICWVDDDELKQQFEHSDAVDFLQFGELCSEENNIFAGKIRSLMQKIGIPALSEVVSREAISYGSRDNGEKEFLINWILPYAQRYIFALHPEIYLKLKQDEHKRIAQLKVIVVETLYYRYTLKGRDSTSKKRFECHCLLQENVLYVVHACDSHSIFLELSRLFFDGSMDLHFANFLHMIATMLEDGSTVEQTECFILQSQKIPGVPDEELVWSLSNTMEWLELENHQPVNAASIDVEQNASKSQGMPGICPTDWKTAPGINPSGNHHKVFGLGLPACVGSQIDFGKPHDTVAHAEVNPTSVEVIQDWDIRENLTLMLQDSLMGDRCSPVSSYDSFHAEIKSTELSPQNMKSTELSKTTGVATHPDPSFSCILPTLNEKDKLSLQKPGDQQLHVTGRLGEMVAYKYFAEKLGPSKVRWVNKDAESGLPYDLTIGDDESSSREYIEVKSTRLANKPWFHISTREWQFATEMGDSFSIARIVLSGQKQASVALFKNPIKLCQKNALSLVILMSR